MVAWCEDAAEDHRGGEDGGVDHDVEGVGEGREGR